MTDSNKDFILLGIKYESASIAGVGEAALENIAGQIRDEVGEDWQSDPMVVRGRNAVREEHGLERLGDSAGIASAPSEKPAPKPWWKFFGR
ncbi:MAG: hypothetical protein WA990_11220 [Rubrobacteraceae bacterium]